jgi:hypothetical protein
MAHEIVGWDGDVLTGDLATRDDRVERVNQYLDGWMNPSDHIIWIFEDDRSDYGAPALACVVTCHGEPTDAWARIVKVAV